jgi:hypothetical protein
MYLPINTNKLITLFSCSKNLACNGNVSALPLASWKYYSKAFQNSIAPLDPHQVAV